MVTVYRCAPRPVREVAPWLVRPELDRVERYRDAAGQARSATGRALLRAAVAQRVDAPARDVVVEQACPHCGGPHGKTRIAGWSDIHVNVSYAGDVVLVALADVPVGIDVERCSRVGFRGFDEVALTEAETADVRAMDPERRDRARTDLWAQKEAVLKLTGEGLDRSPNTVHVGIGATRVDDPRAVLTQVPMPSSYRAWVATVDPPVELTILDGAALLEAAAASARTATGR